MPFQNIINYLISNNTFGNIKEPIKNVLTNIYIDDDQGNNNIYVLIKPDVHFCSEKVTYRHSSVRCCCCYLLSKKEDKLIRDIYGVN